MVSGRRIGQVARLTWRERADLAVAIWELARASRRLAGRFGGQVAAEALADSTTAGFANAKLVARVAWAIPRAAAVVPWRADCLRQAEAARRWLGRNGVAVELRLGARKGADGKLNAHAWLLSSGQLVTGGANEGYREFG